MNGRERCPAPGVDFAAFRNASSRAALSFVARRYTTGR